MGLVIKKLQKSYPEFYMDISLEVKKGELLTLLGPSGCGKTTTLNLIAGFLTPDRGQILLNSVNITKLPPHKRDIGIVFQDYALFPHMNVYKNIGFGLKMAGYDEKSIRRRVTELLKLTRLEGYEKRSVTTLSGGEQQRVALARALAPFPELLLLDEPLSALDAKLRKELRSEIRRIIKEINLTTIYVTHDQEEAMALSDVIAVMKEGKIEQIGTPLDIYLRPETPFVAEFVGMPNKIKARYKTKDKGRLLFTTDEGDFEVSINFRDNTDISFEDMSSGKNLRAVNIKEINDFKETPSEIIKKIRDEKEVLLYFRPESCIINVGKKISKNILRGFVKACEYLGDTTLIKLKTTHAEYQTKISEYKKCAVGGSIQVYVPPERIHVIFKE